MGERKEAEFNIINYVEQNNTSFNEQGFNEIDGLVMSQIANMELDNLGIDLYSNSSKSFQDIYKELTDNPSSEAHKSWLKMDKNSQVLLEKIASNERYKDMMVSNFIKDPVKNKISGFNSVGAEQNMEQFAAVTITYKQNGEIVNFVSYRATDSTSDGWSEDLAMLYSMKTQAQADSVAYMNIIAGKTQGCIDGGGHSKGAGDFEYAYLFCDEEAYSRFRKGYVYDGPGLTEEVLKNTDRYEAYIKATDGSFICPQDSIFGQILHEGNNAVFIHSVESGVNEHDPYSWEIKYVDGKYIFQSDEQTELSKFINDALDRSVKNMTQEEREAFFTFVSYLLYNNGEGDGIDGLSDLFTKGLKNEDGSINREKLKNVLEILASDFFLMSPEERMAFRSALGDIIAAIAATAFDYAVEKVEIWIEEKKQQIKMAINEAWSAIAGWLNERKEQFKLFLENIYKAIVSGFKKVAGWLRSISYGGRYAAENPQIRLDTYKLTSYAQRLQSVNRRISALDSRLDSLYWKVGLLDLWNLVQADLLTGYSWRLDRCVSYLNETASDFNSIETNLISSL